MPPIRKLSASHVTMPAANRSSFFGLGIVFALILVAALAAVKAKADQNSLQHNNAISGDLNATLPTIGALSEASPEATSTPDESSSTDAKSNVSVAIDSSTNSEGKTETVVKTDPPGNSEAAQTKVSTSGDAKVTKDPSTGATKIEGDNYSVDINASNNDGNSESDTSIRQRTRVRQSSDTDINHRSSIRIRQNSSND